MIILHIGSSFLIVNILDTETIREFGLTNIILFGERLYQHYGLAIQICPSSC